MKLKPLTQFICDHCGGVINKPEEGWFEWISEASEQGRITYGYKIVHHALYSPRREQGGNCYYYDHNPKSGSTHLHHLLEPGLVRLLRYLDPGAYIEPDYNGPGIKDMREYVEILRRVMIPYYEEARLYWNEAEADGDFQGANEISLYTPDRLKRIIETYGKE